ncbi:YhgE/Pip domain-containing protein [Saccharopolyspora hirsuta]|uniref:YhgE/Pip domain-containing protein n=1 Tax=Saccharopolyspora hirsuta TaxID=1837 RepID=A0A5M7BI95_SACHI|nr:YhgE/Pip domain-containing protein [Saccharopolyspora hirsuta]KAA5829596.1 YhgE/Pip domain-containing protein [Saccharopolyspora hirsuta]MBF6511039.1 YhgE/Pip domain-containing protein [Nocardia farcinica]
MKAFNLAWLELRRFRGPLRRLVPLVLVLVPLLYGSLYLWSNWDPYGKLGQVPVAVVNSDLPVDARGEHINAGEQFVQQIKATDTFDWHFVDAADARRGLEEGTYYFTIEVPADFSARLATAADRNPERAALHIVKNDANGFIVGIMADTVKTELQNQINAAAHATYARALYGELDQAREKLQLASEASKQLVEGTELSKQGTAALTTGLGGVRDGTGEIARGVRSVSDASAQLDQQLTAITDFTAERLPGAVNALVNASNIAVNSLSAIKTTTGFLSQRAAEGRAAVEELGQKHPDIEQDSAYQRALDISRKIADSAATADGDAQKALATAQDANRQALALQNNLGPLQNQVRAITAPADALRAGTAELAGGSNGITNGLNTLAASSGVLHTGAGQLNDGAKSLQGLVDDTLGKIPPTNPTEVARAADVLGSPTEIHVDNINPAHVYGRGLAPFFFAIALWVFGLFAYLLLKPVNQRAMADRVSAWTIALAGFLPAAALGALGGFVLYAVVDFGLGLDPVHLWWTLGLVALAALAFVAIDHFLRTALGAVGDLLSLVLLIIQLTASGGLYPMETAPVPFQAVHPFLPMSYLVDGLRVTISGGEVQHLLQDVVVLAGFLVVFLLLTTLVVQRQRTWSVARLHPQIEL